MNRYQIALLEPQRIAPQSILDDISPEIKNIIAAAVFEYPILITTQNLIKLNPTLEKYINDLIIHPLDGRWKRADNPRKNPLIATLRV